MRLNSGSNENQINFISNHWSWKCIFFSIDHSIYFQVNFFFPYFFTTNDIQMVYSSARADAMSYKKWKWKWNKLINPDGFSMPAFLSFSNGSFIHAVHLFERDGNSFYGKNTRSKKPHFQWNQLYFSLIKSSISNRFKLLFICLWLLQTIVLFI